MSESDYIATLGAAVDRYKRALQTGGPNAIRDAAAELDRLKNQRTLQDRSPPPSPQPSGDSR